MPDETPFGALVHPILSLPLSLLARWRGYMTFHGGAFFHADGAWAIVGNRTAGKSSMLASLGEGGVPIVTDDLLVIDNGWALAGPRCVDLRPDVTEHFPSARYLAVVGGRPRFRLSTPPAPVRTRLRGLFVLEWSESPQAWLEPLDAQARLKLLYDQEYMGVVGAASPRQIMGLVGLPAWCLHRPRDWAATPAVVEQLLEAADAQPRV